MPDALWSAVDRLTHDTKDRVERDDGSTEWVPVPCLLDQAHDALVNGSEAQGSQWGTDSDRSPVDLELLTICALIRNTTERSLYQRRQRPHPDRTLPAHVRQLATYAVTHEPQDEWWWTYRFDSWARLLTQHLHLVAHVATTVRLRNSTCPRCAARQVRVETDEGIEVVPAIVVEFHNGLVHVAQCQACAHVWWRGDDLYDLAAALSA